MDERRSEARRLRSQEALSISQIAERLTLSPLTVKTHVSHLLTKLELRERAQLVVLAYESGLVVAGSRDERQGDAW